MADGSTTTYSFTLPEVGASEDTWGTKLNANWTSIDGLLDGTTAISPDINSGTFNGTIDGATSVTADMSYGDNNKAQFGASNDLQIYHDGTNSYIDDQGEGNLNIRASNNFYVYNSAGTATLFRAANGAGNYLYYDNAPKLTTTSTGVDVTGALGVTTVDLGNWTITESAGVLYFATGGVDKMKLDATGNLTVVGDVTAFGTV